MAPLSLELSGLILQHDHFGSHLDDQGRTVDEELEKNNFNHAGKVLAEIWSNTVIDNNPTLATYIDPDTESIFEFNECCFDESWRVKHVRAGHYLLQVYILLMAKNIRRRIKLLNLFA
jgi:hypothetical protein